VSIAPELDQCRTKYGKFIFPKNDIYIGRSLSIYGQYCESEVSLFRQIIREGDIVVDAGANIGAFAVPISQMIGDNGLLYAFEPQPFLCSVLSTNLLTNGCSNARPMSVALGDEMGKITVQNINYAAKNNFGGISFATERANVAKNSAALGIPKMRLDDILDVPRLRLIKADVEGMELALLNGAKDLLETHKPYLYLECDSPEPADPLIAFLKQYDYQCFWHVSTFYDAKNWKEHTEDVFGNVVCVNMLCAPKEANVTNFAVANGSASHPKAK
jgi:FkbM family methyltransferase